MTRSLLSGATVTAGARSTTASRRAVLADSLVIGSLGFLIAVAWSWVPSVWYDEAATVASATRSWQGLAGELTVVDMVHAVYYAGMHVWFDLVGYSPFTLRLPSAVAIGIAAGGLVALLHRISTRRLALVAGVVFIVLPRVAWAGAEGRSFALGTALTVGMAALLVEAIRRSSSRLRTRVLWWAAYGAVAALSIAIFIYLALAVIAAGVTVAIMLLRPEHRRDAVRAAVGWTVAAALAVAASAPVTLAAVRQSGQVSWIDPIGAKTPGDIIEYQYFAEHPKLGALFWLIALVGVVLTLTRAVDVRPRPRPHSVRQHGDSPMPSVLALMLPLLIVPPAALIGVSLVASPLYSPRYATFTAPAFAVLVALALVWLRPRVLVAAATAVLVALCVPAIVANKQPEAKQESSWAEVSAFLEQKRSELPEGTSEGVVYGTVRYHPSASARVTAYSYPDAFEGLDDATLRESLDDSGQLWETQYPLLEVVDDFADDDVVWLITSTSRDQRPAVTSALLTVGLTLDDEWKFEGVRLLRYTR